LVEILKRKLNFRPLGKKRQKWKRSVKIYLMKCKVMVWAEFV
jgi:hypothetical protein